MNDEDHFLNHTLICRSIVNEAGRGEYSGLKDRKVLEIGVGHGEFTTEILKHNPQLVIGYEIVKGRCQINDPRFSLIEEDIAAIDMPDYTGYVVVCSPPYSLLPFIKEKILDRFGIKESLMISSEKYLGIFPDHKVVNYIHGEAFTPPSTGKHFVIRQGLNKHIIYES